MAFNKIRGISVGADLSAVCGFSQYPSYFINPHNLHELIEYLLMVVENTMQPIYVSFWLYTPGKDEL